MKKKTEMLTRNEHDERESAFEQLKIYGGRKLFGCVEVDASKNAFLPILAGCLLCEDEVCLKNYVNLSDLGNMRKILNVLNVSSSLSGKELYINPKKIENVKITHDLASLVRASIIVLGALLGRFRGGVIAYPGGCKIGSRPIDIHLKSFRALGVRVIERHGYIYCHGQNMKAGKVVLDFPSVGATESLMLCGCLLNGESVFLNVAKEPEIVDLQNFLNAMGADVSGAGTDCIVVRGVKKLHGGQFSVMPDRIVAGTYLLAAAICGGDVEVEKTFFRHNESLISFLRQSACKIDVFDDRIRLRADKRLSSIPKIQTLPYPSFPTDLQPQMMVLQAVSSGVSIIQENLFENRFGVVPELRKMGADIVIKDRTACVVGVEKLYGADVCASDLRAGAALVLAGLKAEGYTTISNVSYIDRGYERIEEKLSLLGADIKRGLFE